MTKCNCSIEAGIEWGSINDREPRIRKCPLCKAAPELLEACKEALDGFKEYFEHITSVACTRGRLKRAIAEATEGKPHV